MSADPGGSTSADGSSHLAPAAGAEIAARAVLLLVVLVALVDCWCRSAIGCRPAVAGGTIVRPAAVCVAFGCALVCCVLGVVDALAPSEALAQAKAVSLLVAAGACWPVALVVLRTSAWRAESALGTALGSVGRCLPVCLVAVLALAGAAASALRSIAWPLDGGALHPHAPDDEATALLASIGPGALTLVVLLSGCFADADGALSPGATLSIVFAAMLGAVAGCVATRKFVHAELANLPKGFPSEALCSFLLAGAALCAWCGVRVWVTQREAGAELGRRGGMWGNSASAGLGAGLLADAESTDEEGGFKSRLPPTIMKRKPEPDPIAVAAAAAARPGGAISNTTETNAAASAAADDNWEAAEAQRLANAAARGSRNTRPLRRRSRPDNVRRSVAAAEDEESGDSEDDGADPNSFEEQEARMRMPPPEPRFRRAAPPAATPLTNPASPAAKAQPAPPAAALKPPGGPGSVAAAAMALRRAYRSGRERKKRGAWEGAVTAFGEALNLYHACVDSGATAEGIALGGGFSSSESEGGAAGGVLMLGRVYNQRAQCYEKLKKW